MKKITKKEVIAMFNEMFPRETFLYHNDLDKIMRREMWNDFIDSLCKDGTISEKQYNNWVHPWRD